MIYNSDLTEILTDPDLTLGRLEPAKRLVAHHDAVPYQVQYEVMPGTITDDCPDGLRQEIITPAQEAWDEYEDVQRYVPYTEAELAERAAQAEREQAAADALAKAEQEQAAADAAAKAEQEAKIAKIDAIEAQTTYTAMMTDTLMEESV